MSDLKRAYEILGLPEDAGRDDVERKYELLLKKFRKTKGAVDSEDGLALEEVNGAYRRIIRHLEERERAAMPKRHPVVEKLSHIWEYYRVHILATVCVLLLAGYTVYEISGSGKDPDANADLKVLFFGEFRFPEAESAEQWLEQQFPEWPNGVGVTVQYVPVEPKDEYDIAMAQKAIVTLATEKPDIYILDAANYGRYAAQGAFLSLDEWTDRLNLDLERHAAYKVTAKEESVPHLYGVIVTNSEAFRGLPLKPGTELVAAIRFDAKDKEKAIQAIARLSSKR